MEGNSQDTYKTHATPYTIVERWLPDGSNYLPAAALAAAGVNILSVTRLKNFKRSDYVEQEGVEDEYISLAVCYEFQWRNRGNYTWSKVFNTYTVEDGAWRLFLNIDGSEIDGTDSETLDRLFYPEDGSPRSVTDITVAVVDQIIKEVILTRDQLEDPDDRGYYQYYFVPDGLPKHIQKEYYPNPFGY